MSSKGRRYRRRNHSEEDADQNESTSVQEKLEEIRELQKFRVRPKGVTETDLRYGREIVDSGKDVSDPLKLKTGGLLDLNVVKDRHRDRSGEGSDKDVTSLGNTFSQETNRRDEDVEMLRFIDEQLAKRKRKPDEKKEEFKRPKSKEDLLYEVPDQIDIKSKVMKSEEMLSNQMLSGIPEVDLGIQAKILNIEATEEAKGKLLNEMRTKKSASSEFVPRNLASNFLLHERFFNEQKAMESEKQKNVARHVGRQIDDVEKPGPIVKGAAKDGGRDVSLTQSKGKKIPSNDASDDYLYNKFKAKTSDSWRYQ